MRKLLAIGILLLLLAACGRGRNAEQPTATAPVADTSAATTAPATDPTAAPTAPGAAQADAPSDSASSADAQEAVLNAMRLQLAGGPYRAVTTVESHDTTTEMTVEAIPPNKMHVVISGGAVEMIMIDGTLWSKSGESPWTQMGSAEMIEGILDSIGGDIEASTLTNVQITGAEPVLGDAAQIYSFTSTFGEGDGLITSDTRLWISNASGLPLRMEATSTAMGTTSQIVQMIDYDDTITIEPPTP